MITAALNHYGIKFNNMARLGKIVSIDYFLGEGEIMDEHEQEISFSLKHAERDLSVGSGIAFEIQLTDSGLRAIEIKRINY